MGSERQVLRREQESESDVRDNTRLAQIALKSVVVILSALIDENETLVTTPES